jgi:hypothetical protein
MHEITYTYEDANGCVNDSTQTITVNDLPVVTFDPVPAVCIDAEPFTLTGGMPEGGTYSGTGVSDGTFDPAVAGLGTHDLTYTYEDANGCINAAGQTVTVNPLPEPDLGADTTICSSQSVELDATTAGAVSYLWQPGGQTTAQITVDTTGFGLGIHTFVVTVTDANGCSGSDAVNVEFEDCPGIGELAGVNDISLFPNPGQGAFSLRIEASKALDINIKVYNNRGVSVYEQEGLMVTGTEQISIDLNGQPSGIYMVNVYNRQGRWIEKLVIRK